MVAAITLVFPHQLFAEHSALAVGRPVHLIEDTLFFGDPHASPGRFHQQKIVLHRASMKAWQTRVEAIGHEVTYHDYVREMTIADLLTKLHHEAPFEEIVTTEPADFLLEKRLRRFCGEKGVRLTVTASPLFLTPQDWADRHFETRKKPFMAAFYEAQRKRLGILLDATGGPEGGRWSYDEDNRKPMPKKGLAVPAEPTAPRRAEVEEALLYVATRFSHYPGRTAEFRYAVTHEDASDWFEVFLTERLAQFGPYEDALAAGERVLFHSLLTPALNIGLLTPQQVVDRTLAYAATHTVPLASLEGFLRQIIGWREFIYHMYRRHGVEMRTRNFFGHTRKLPDSFWTASTGLAPLDLVIDRVLATGYAHHIERLMVLGNFMLLGQYEPRQVNDWFMELFIDAYDWVMVPNVFAMSQFADGGIFTTKPYFSGSNYLKKMSDYRPGPWGAVWDGLFWNFIDQHHGFFKAQYRLSLIAKSWEKMEAAKRELHLQNAAAFFQAE